jgi:hypothetical protein
MIGKVSAGFAASGDLRKVNEIENGQAVRDNVRQATQGVYRKIIALEKAALTRDA